METAINDPSLDIAQMLDQVSFSSYQKYGIGMNFKTSENPKVYDFFFLFQVCNCGYDRFPELSFLGDEIQTCKHPKDDVIV